MARGWPLQPGARIRPIQCERVLWLLLAAQGKTLLIIAAEKGHTEACRMLVRKGACLETQSDVRLAVCGTESAQRNPRLDRRARTSAPLPPVTVPDLPLSFGHAQAGRTNFRGNSSSELVII